MQGENSLARENHRLGLYKYDGIPAAPAMQESFLITFKIDVDGLLTVTTKVLSLGVEHEEKIQP